MAKKKNYQKAEWGSAQRSHFVTLLELHADSPNGKMKGWSADAWAKISAGMRARFPAVNFTVKRLKQMENRLRGSHEFIQDIGGRPALEALYSEASSIEPTRAAQQDDKQEEEDFSIERCIAEYSKLPLAERKTYDFKGVLELFEYNEKMREAYINFPKDRIHQRTAWLNEALIRLMIKKREKIDNLFWSIPNPAIPTIQECMDEYEKLDECKGDDLDLVALLFEHPSHRELFITFDEDFKRWWLRQMLPIIRKQQEERKQLTARSTSAPLAE